MRSFRYGFAGIGQLLSEEHNSRIHLVATVAVIALGAVCRISAGEWCAVALCIGLVFMAEAMNSAVEALCDLVMPEYHPLIKKAKDIAAAGVLMAAIAAVVVGGIIFVPKIIALF